MAITDEIKTTLDNIQGLIDTGTLRNNQGAVTFPELQETQYPAITPPATPSEDPYKLFKEYASTLTPPSSTSDIYNTEYANAGIDQKNQDVINSQKELDAINAQLTDITGQANMANITLEQNSAGKDVTTQFLGRQQQAVSREAALKAIPLQTAALVAQSKVSNNINLLSAAKEKLSTFFQLKSQDAKNKNDYNNALISKFFDFASEAEKTKLQEKRIQDDRRYNEYKGNLDLIDKWSGVAIDNGQSNLIPQLTKLDPNDPLFTQKLGEIQRQIRVSTGGGTGGTGGSGGGQLSTITQAVIENPNLLNSLTPTVKGNVIAELQGAGYDTTNLGTKALSDTAIKEISQTDLALTNLNDLKAKIEGNLQYIGPIKGLSALNPWSKARQVQADIDRVKQTVGKALEGGVLRKEDEDKYKKILATINDTPETASYKINQLITSITKNLEDYKTLQENSGKSLDIKSSLQKKGLATGKTSTGNSFTITKE